MVGLAALGGHLRHAQLRGFQRPGGGVQPGPRDQLGRLQAEHLPDLPLEAAQAQAGALGQRLDPQRLELGCGVVVAHVVGRLGDGG